MSSVWSLTRGGPGAAHLSKELAGKRGESCRKVAFHQLCPLRGGPCPGFFTCPSHWRKKKRHPRPRMGYIPHLTQQIERKSSEIRLPQTPISGMYQCDIRVVIKKHHFGSRVAPDASRRVFAGRGICPFVSWSRIVLHHLRKGNAKLNIQHTPGNFRTVSL